jgi:hypothetical protein
MTLIGIALAAVLLLLTINGTYYFLAIAKVSFLEWLVFNACAPSNITYILCFIIFLLTGDRTVLHIAILPLFFFGGLGLYLFPWTGHNIYAQISHIFMTLNIVWVLYGTFGTGNYKAAAIGLLLGILIFAPFITFQQTYVGSHPEALKKVLGVSTEDFQKKLNM